MYYLNKIVGGVVSPMGVGLALIALGLVLLKLKRRRWSVASGIAAFAWLYICSCGIVSRFIGLPLEAEFPRQAIEDLPQAELIVVLGGGIASNPNAGIRAEIEMAGDRVLYGAELWKAGKAPRIHVTMDGDALLLERLGVPKENIIVEREARNTEEEARSVARFFELGLHGVGPGSDRVASQRMLLVTSAWHMKRAMLIFGKYAKWMEVVPAATDYEATVRFAKPVQFVEFVPSADGLAFNSYMMKEWIGYLGYKWLRD